MVPASGKFCKLEVPFYLAPFAFGAYTLVSVLVAPCTVVDVASAKKAVVFAVGCDDAPVVGCRFHGFQHHFPALYAAPVIGERYASAFEAAEVHELLSLSPEGDGGVWQYLYDCVPVDDVLFEVQMLEAVRHRV